MNSAQSFVSRRENFVRRYYHAECHAEAGCSGLPWPVYFSFVFFTCFLDYLSSSWLILAIIFRAVKRHDFVAVVAPQRNKPGKTASHRTFSSCQIGHKLCSALPWHALFFVASSLFPSRAETSSHSSPICDRYGGRSGRLAAEVVSCIQSFGSLDGKWMQELVELC